jgi:hypothetical protein
VLPLSVFVSYRNEVRGPQFVILALGGIAGFAAEVSSLRKYTKQMAESDGE